MRRGEQYTPVHDPEQEMGSIRRSSQAAACIGFAAMLLSCSRDATGPGTGTLNITITTSSAPVDLDLDGYTLRVDDGAELRVAVSQPVTNIELQEGTHIIRLGGLEPNCSSLGGSEASVEIVPSVAATAFFTVSCSANMGSVEVTTITTGVDTDSDGYEVNIAGAATAVLPPNGTYAFDRVRTGQRAVALTGLSTNCEVEGTRLRTVNVTYAAITRVVFPVNCLQTGRATVNVTTTGSDIDPDGYIIRLAAVVPGYSTVVRVAVNGSGAFDGLLPGRYEMSISEVTPNCSVVNRVQPVEITAGNASSARFDVACAPTSRFAIVEGHGSGRDIYAISLNGSGRVQLTTYGGADLDPAWSPDGSRIAFASERGGNFDIYISTLR